MLFQLLSQETSTVVQNTFPIIAPQGKINLSILKIHWFYQPNKESEYIFVHRNNIKYLGYDTRFADDQAIEFEVEETKQIRG